MVTRMLRQHWLSIAGAVIGGAAGFAYYVFWGCDSG
jgi:hypothetical protein